METEQIDEIAAIVGDCDVVRSKSCGDIGFVFSRRDVNDAREALWLRQKCCKKLQPDDVVVVDRYLSTGDTVVDSKNYHSGQAGIIVDVHRSVDLSNAEGSIIRGVDSRELRSIMDHRTNELVVLGPWIGRVDDFTFDITVLFDNGTICLVEEEGDCFVDSIVELASNGSHFLPGMRVKVIDEPDVGYTKLGVELGMEGTITKAAIKSVHVFWLCLDTKRNSQILSHSPPSEYQSPNNLKFGHFFSHGIWKLYDWCYLSSTAQLSLLGENKGWTKTQLCDPLKPFFIVSTKTRFDVLWQDGTIGKQIDSTSLLHTDDTPALLFHGSSLFPEQFVCKAITNNCCDMGIIRSVNVEENTAHVRWLKQESNNNDAVVEENVSVFEIDRHPECGYLCGNLVGWLPPISSSSTCTDLPRFGIITRIMNGDIEVSWAGGTVSTVGPQEIYWIDDDDTKINQEQKVTFGNFWRRFQILSAVLVILGYFSRLFCRMISLWDRICTVPFNINSIGENKLQCQGSHRNLNFFKSFDAAKDPSDHYFFATKGKDIVGRKWLRNVQKEWSVLENDLPDGIYVRVYEDRMDLLRAAIIGPCGTPYQDGLFIFDVHLPAEYPNVPPKVHYHYGGWRVNPNLNPDGTICLSLLNTFEGRGTEAWDSSSSNILQVLVSIQGLVLTSKPFFNESGYEHLMGSLDGERSSLDYNENAFMMNCKTMMYLIRRPLKDFEELVREHFARRGCNILKACNNYREGHLIGSLTKDAEPAREINDEDQSTRSKGFKLMLDKIIRELFLSFSEVGADCSEFKNLYNDRSSALR